MPPAKKDRPRKPAVSPEEQSMFLEAIAGAMPLDGRDRVPVPTPPPRPLVKPVVAPPREALTVEHDGDGLTVAGRGAGVNRSQLAALRGGQVRVEATLDLHGMLAAEAEPALTRFLIESSQQLRRCVLIVHGRGLHSDGVAVLRDIVLAALTGPLSGLVHAFSSAAPRDGGPGATYVMVRT
jgi:DNA-nicking Smr family endonuclease